MEFYFFLWIVQDGGCLFEFLGRGLTLVASVLEGDHHDRLNDIESVKHGMNEMMKRERVKGMAEVIVAKHVGDGISYLWVSIPSANHEIVNAYFIVIFLKSALHDPQKSQSQIWVIRHIRRKLFISGSLARYASQTTI